MSTTANGSSASRQHAYLNAVERHELERLQHELGASASYVLRVGLRLLAGLPVPREFHDIPVRRP